MTLPQSRIRIRFTKMGDLRWISHRDLARAWERLLRRAAIPMVFSQGFHPKPRISFPSALALGVESCDEVVEIEVAGEWTLEDLADRISEQMPPGMRMTSMEIAPRKARALASTFLVELPPELIESARSGLARLMEQDRIEVDRDGKRVNCPVHQPHFDVRLEGQALVFTLPHFEARAALRPSELLAVLGLEQILESGASLRRTRLHLADDAPWTDASPSSSQTTESGSHTLISHEQEFGQP